MKTYSLGAAPTCAGIYYLMNKRTGHIYVGQSVGLRRRLTEWRNALSSGFGHTNSEMYNILQHNPDLDEWVFVVAKEMPGADREALLAAEQEEIERLRHLKGGLVLNTNHMEKLVASPSNNFSRATVVIHMPDGTPIGQLKASQILGRNPDTIRDKVRWLREQGVRKVNVFDLTMDRRKLLEKIEQGEEGAATS